MENIEKINKVFLENKKWIAKPSKGSKGIGIKVFETKDELKNIIKGYNKSNKKWIVSELIEPDLINGKKYHFRVYVLITQDDNGNINGYISNDSICYLAYSRYKSDDFRESVMLTNLDAARRSAKNENIKFDMNKYVFNFFDIYSKYKNKNKLDKKLKDICSLTIRAYKEKIKCGNRNLNSFLGCFHILA